MTTDSEIVAAVYAEIEAKKPWPAGARQLVELSVAAATPMIEARLLGEMFKQTKTTRYHTITCFDLLDFAKSKNLTIPGMEN